MGWRCGLTVIVHVSIVDHHLFFSHNSGANAPQPCSYFVFYFRGPFTNERVGRENDLLSGVQRIVTTPCVLSPEGERTPLSRACCPVLHGVSLYIIVHHCVIGSCDDGQLIDGSI